MAMEWKDHSVGVGMLGARRHRSCPPTCSFVYDDGWPLATTELDPPPLPIPPPPPPRTQQHKYRRAAKVDRRFWSSALNENGECSWNNDRKTDLGELLIFWGRDPKGLADKAEGRTTTTSSTQTTVNETYVLWHEYLDPATNAPWWWCEELQAHRFDRPERGNIVQMWAVSQTAASSEYSVYERTIYEV